MRILITGGGGFAGGFLVEYFYKKGYEVIATYRTNMSMKMEGVEYIRQELSEKIILNKKVDAIIHTAVSASGRELPMTDYLRDNVDSARNIVDFARENGVGCIVYFSTRTVYGDINKREIIEDDDIINPNKYGTTKRIAELIFQEATDLNTIGLRIPNIIGPGAHDIWLTRIANKIKNNEDVEISDFETKNLVSIYDVSKFIEKLLIVSSSGKKFRYNIVNISSDKTINNLEIAEHIKSRVGSASRIIRVKPGSGLFWLNSERAYEMGYESSEPIAIIDSYLDYLVGTSADETGD